MNRTEWLLKFRSFQKLETLEKIYEYLIYNGDPSEEFAMTQAYDHRKAEFVAERLFNRVPAYIWQYVK